MGRVGALLLLTTAPLVQAGTSSADGLRGPVQERRAQADDSDRRDAERDAHGRDTDRREADDRDSADERDLDDDRPTAMRGVSSRQRYDARDDRERGYRGRHRLATGDVDESDDRRSARTLPAGSSGTGSYRQARRRAAESVDGAGPGRRASTRTATADRAASTRTTGADRVPESRWDRLAQCESRQRWSANTGNGYRGGLQFSDATWRAYGGARYAPSAHQASRDEQIAVAEKVRRDQGWSAWPACSRKLGYT